MKRTFGMLEVKVGIMFLVVAGLVGFFSIKVSENPNLFKSTRQYWFVVDDASGLIKNGAVRMSGIKVGTIKDIRLYGSLARLDLNLKGDTPVRLSSTIEIRPHGILGDKYVEITPGNPNDEILDNGLEIKPVINQGSMDALLKEVGSITSALGDLADSLKQALQDGGENSGPLGRIIHNIDELTAEVTGVVKGQRVKIESMLDNLHEISETLDRVINDETNEGFQAAWKRAVKGLDRIDRSLANIEEITGKINSGEGTIGRLINDEETVKGINTAITGVNNFLGGAKKIQTSIDFRSEFLFEQSLAKTYLGVRIQPGLDRYYEVHMVDDPKGVVETVDTTTTTNPDTPSAGPPSTVREQKVFKNKVKLTLLYAKNFYNFTVKGGLIENAGGIGFDYFLLRHKLRLSLEAFDFSGGTAHLRGSVRYSFYKGIYLQGGADDFASQTGTYSSFLGVGLNLTNDDIKTLVSKVSF